MSHFTDIDQQKFHELWSMNFNVCKNLAAQACVADKILNAYHLGRDIDDKIEYEDLLKRLWFLDQEQVLGYTEGKIIEKDNVLDSEAKLAPWQKSKIRKPLDIMGLAATDSTVMENMDLPESVYGDEEEEFEKQQQPPIENLVKHLANNTNINLSEDTIRTILPLLAEEGDFLFEKKLFLLLDKMCGSNYNDNATTDSMLIKLDAIFNSLGVSSEEDIGQLVDYLNSELRNCSDEEDSKSEISFMSINKIVPALKKYISQNAEKINLEVLRQSAIAEKQNKKYENSGFEYCAQEPKYWKSIANALGPDSIKIWDALYLGLEKYHEVLSQRQKMIEHNGGLKRQNEELRGLLQKYLSGAVNKELVHAPGEFL